MFLAVFVTCQTTAVAVRWCRERPPLKDSDLLKPDANFPFAFDIAFALFM
jgi:hypothetical protein